MGGKEIYFLVCLESFESHLANMLVEMTVMVVAGVKYFNNPVLTESRVEWRVV